MEPYTVSHVIPYTYEPLPEGDFIRLMHLQPALVVDAPLRFTFAIGHIDSLVAQYEAISYTWGEPRLDLPLHIDDTCTMVTRNLDKALRRLRLPTTSRILWADAVCINQKDDQEKSRQIPLMTRLFRSASRVLAWLDGGDEEERGMQALNSLSRRSVPTFFESQENIEPSDRKTIGKFIGLAWFTRLWIVQEGVMNADVVLICQSSKLSWLRFTTALSICANHYRSILDQGLDILLHVIKLWKCHNTTIETPLEMHQSRQLGIVKLVDMFLPYGCTDPRDRIFALYNVAVDVRATALRKREGRISPWSADYVNYMDVDYSLDVRQVYHTFAVACISGGSDVDIFQAVLSRTTFPSSEDWPSWVPDLRKPISSRGQWWINRGTMFKVHDIQPDILSMSWERLDDVKSPIVIIDTILALPSADSRSSMDSFLRTQLNACPSSMADCILQESGFVQLLVEIWGTYQEMDLPLCLESEAQRPRLFMADFSSSTERSLGIGIGSVDLLEGDEVALHTPLYQGNLCQEWCLLLRKRSEFTDIEGNTGMSHRLIGMAQVVRNCAPDPLPDYQTVILNLR